MNLRANRVIRVFIKLTRMMHIHIKRIQIARTRLRINLVRTATTKRYARSLKRPALANRVRHAWKRSPIVPIISINQWRQRPENRIKRITRRHLTSRRLKDRQTLCRNLVIGTPARVLHVVTRAVRLHIRITRQRLHRLHRRVVFDRIIRAAWRVILSNRRTPRLDQPERWTFRRRNLFNLDIR